MKERFEDFKEKVHNLSTVVWDRGKINNYLNQLYRCCILIEELFTKGYDDVAQELFIFASEDCREIEVKLFGSDLY